MTTIHICSDSKVACTCILCQTMFDVIYIIHVARAIIWIVVRSLTEYHLKNGRETQELQYYYKSYSIITLMSQIVLINV